MVFLKTEKNSHHKPARGSFCHFSRQKADAQPARWKTSLQKKNKCAAAKQQISVFSLLVICHQDGGGKEFCMFKMENLHKCTMFDPSNNVGVRLRTHTHTCQSSLDSVPLLRDSLFHRPPHWVAAVCFQAAVCGVQRLCL